MRRFTMLAICLLAVASFMTTTAWADPHQVGACTLTQSGNTLTIEGKEAGLGSLVDTVSISFSADASCINPGSNKPKAANKTTVSGSGTFDVNNGKADFSLTGTATFQPDCTPPMTVVYSNLTVTDTTSGVTFSCH